MGLYPPHLLFFPPPQGASWRSKRLRSPQKQPGDNSTPCLFRILALIPMFLFFQKRPSFFLLQSTFGIYLASGRRWTPSGSSNTCSHSLLPPPSIDNSFPGKALIPVWLGVHSFIPPVHGCDFSSLTPFHNLFLPQEGVAAYDFLDSLPMRNSSTPERRAALLPFFFLVNRFLSVVADVSLFSDGLKPRLDIYCPW